MLTKECLEQRVQAMARPRGCGDGHCHFGFAFCVEVVWADRLQRHHSIPSASLGNGHVCAFGAKVPRKGPPVLVANCPRNGTLVCLSTLLDLQRSLASQGCAGS